VRPPTRVLDGGRNHGIGDDNVASATIRTLLMAGRFRDAVGQRVPCSDRRCAAGELKPTSDRGRGVAVPDHGRALAYSGIQRSGTARDCRCRATRQSGRPWQLAAAVKFYRRFPSARYRWILVLGLKVRLSGWLMFLDQLDSLNDDLTLYVPSRDPVAPDTPVALIDEDVDEEPQSMAYPLEVHLVKEVLRVWKAWRGGSDPNLRVGSYRGDVESAAP
jgi:hypothetical protein